MRPVPQIALDFLARVEACRLKAYPDSAGVWTIGYGHTGEGVRRGLAIGRRRARAWLLEDADAAARRLAERLKPDVLLALTDHQYAALISLVFNVGASPRWTIWKVINAGAFDQAPQQIMRFDKVRTAGDVRTLPGLTHRRAAEVALWNTPDAAAAARVALASATLPPPSSQTRAAETPPAPAAVKPLHRSRSFAAAAATATAALPVAVESVRSGASAVSRAIGPYAERSAWLQDVVGFLAIVCAAMATLSVALQWLRHRRAKSR